MSVPYVNVSNGILTEILRETATDAKNTSCEILSLCLSQEKFHWMTDSKHQITLYSYIGHSKDASYLITQFSDNESAWILSSLPPALRLSAHVSDIRTTDFEQQNSDTNCHNTLILQLYDVLSIWCSLLLHTWQQSAKKFALHGTHPTKANVIRPVTRLNVGTKTEKGLRPLQPSVTGTHMLRFEQCQFQSTALNSMSAMDGPAGHRVRKHTVTPSWQEIFKISNTRPGKIRVDWKATPQNPWNVPFSTSSQNICVPMEYHA